jgi:hypothetical protein
MGGKYFLRFLLLKSGLDWNDGGRMATRQGKGVDLEIGLAGIYDAFVIVRHSREGGNPSGVCYSIVACETFDSSDEARLGRQTSSVNTGARRITALH